jgi:hypothetical protein
VATGTSYTFAVYSDALQLQFGLSSDQLETVSVSCFLGGFVTFIPVHIHIQTHSY